MKISNLFLNCKLSLSHISAQFCVQFSSSGTRVQLPGRVTIPLGTAILGKLFTHIASPVSQLQETGVQKGSFRRLSVYGD